MASHDEWRSIIASALDWDQAHAKFDSAVEGLAPELRGKLPDNFPHSVWMLVDHIRRTQHDLLDFCRNPNYEEKLKWPDDYWPTTTAPASEAEWNESIAQIRRDTQSLKEFTETADAAQALVKKLYLYTNNHFSAKSVANAAILKHDLGQSLPGEYPQEFVDRYPDLKGIVKVLPDPLLRTPS